MEKLINREKGQDTAKTQKKVTSPSLNRFLTILPPKACHHSPFGPLILPACFGLVQQTGGDGSREGEWKRQRMCRAHKWGGADSCGLRGVRRCVKLGLQKSGAERRLPATPNINLDGLSAWRVHRRPDSMKILQGVNNSQQHTLL